MRLKSAIDKLADDAEFFFRPRIPDVSILLTTAEAIEHTFSGAEAMPPAEDLVELADRVTAAVHTGASSSIRSRDWRMLPWCLWLKERPLAKDQKVLDAYLAWLQAGKHIRAYNNLIAAYLANFDRQLYGISEIAGTLIKVVDQFNWAWRERHKRFHLFSPDDAPNSIAIRVLVDDGPLDDALSEVGLSGELANQGLAREAALRALALYRINESSDDHAYRDLLRLIDWFEEDGNLRFGGITGRLADSLLLPWATDRRNPTKKVIETTRDFLLKHLKDPRRSEGLWHSVSPDALAVMRMWLVRDSLDRFLDVVDDIASEDLRLQWPYRRAFWEAYYKRNAISDAWVVFSRVGASRARRIDVDHLRFGKLQQGSQVQPNHAVLLLKIGSLTVAEWSENGKCHIWRSSNNSAPKLYLDGYDRLQLINGSDNGGQIHGGSENGRWQQHVASFIARHAGIRVSEREYMPSRRPWHG